MAAMLGVSVSRHQSAVCRIGFWGSTLLPLSCQGQMQGLVLIQPIRGHIARLSKLLRHRMGHPVGQPQVAAISGGLRAKSERLRNCKY